MIVHALKAFHHRLHATADVDLESGNAEKRQTGRLLERHNAYQGQPPGAACHCSKNETEA